MKELTQLAAEMRQTVDGTNRRYAAKSLMGLFHLGLQLEIGNTGKRVYRLELKRHNCDIDPGDIQLVAEAFNVPAGVEWAKRTDKTVRPVLFVAWCTWHEQEKVTA